MAPNDPELDPVRRRLVAAVDHAGTTLAAVSRALERNHAYLHQFVHRGSPRRLNAETCARIGAILGIDPRELDDGREPVRRQRRRGAAPLGMSLTAFARRLTIARLEAGHATPAAFCEAAGIDRYRFADLEDGLDDPTIEELDRIAAASGKTLDWLIRGPHLPSVDEAGHARETSYGEIDPGETGTGENPDETKAFR